MKKKEKNAKGFSNIKNERLSRRQKQELEKEFRNIINKLSSSNRQNLSKNMTKLQAITRGKQTRKRFPEYKKKILKQQQKKNRRIYRTKIF